MPERTLTTRRLLCVTALFLIGSSSMAGSSGIAGQDTWAAVLLALCGAAVLALLYARVSALYPGQSLPDLMHTAFGPVLGRLSILLFTLYSFRIAAMVLRDFPEFVHTTALPRTPLAIFTLLLALVCAYLASLGPAGFGRTAVLFFAVVTVSAGLTFLLLLPNMDIDHLRPVLATDTALIGENALRLLCAPFGESVLLLALYGHAAPGARRGRAFLGGLLCGGLYLTVSVLRNILALGAANFQSVYYPSYSAVGLIDIGGFLQRVEVLVAGYLLVCDVVKIAVALYAAAVGVQALFRLSSHRKAVLPLALAAVPVSVLAFPSTMAFYQWSPIELVIAAPFQLVLPVLLWVVGEVRRFLSARRERNSLPV